MLRNPFDRIMSLKNEMVIKTSSVIYDISLSQKPEGPQGLLVKMKKEGL